MKAPLSWLKKYLKLEESPEAIAEVLTLSGLEVDKIDRYEFSFSSVTIGRVIETTPHPKADNLKIAIVFDGKKKHQVVCGDPSLRKDISVPFAGLGASLIDEKGNFFLIEKAKIRGIDSFGMLCTEKELRLSNAGSAVMILPEDAPIGGDLAEYLRDPVFDIALTPNLGYCRSIIGICRELSAQLNKSYVLPQFQLREDPDNTSHTKIQVSNEAHDHCLQYKCRIIQGVEIAPSPPWLKDWIEKSGYKSINNIVDITNFVMHELGQPLHAFDYDKLESKQITIRPAKKNETIVTLDEVIRKPPEGSLLICDGEIPIAIAGVMGDKESAISDKTHTILLEAAHFKESSIRRTSRLLGLRTESSARFENGIDPNLVQLALDRAANLMQDIAGGRVLKGTVEQSPHPYRPRFLTCRLSKINALLGTQFGLGEVESYLTRLGITTTSDGTDLYQLKIPSWRGDIHSEVDIIEDVARVYGYNNIAPRAPRHVNSLIPHHPIYLLEKETRARLIAKGLQEFLTCDLISPELCNLEIEHGLFSSEYINVLHAKSVDQSILRPSLLPGLLQVAKHNQNQGNFDISAFEIGRVHFKEDEGFEEKTSLGIILIGKKAPHHFDTKPGDVDFYDLKGILESLFESLLLKEISFEDSSYRTFHPGRQAAIRLPSGCIGVLGEIHPSSLRHLSIKGRALFAEIDLHEIQKHRPKGAKFTLLPEFPSSQRDITLTMKKKQTLDDAFKALQSFDGLLLKKWELIDIYTSEQIGNENKNVTFRFTYRDDTKTLDLEAVETEHAVVVKTLQKQIRR